MVCSGLTYEEREDKARRTAQYSPKTGRLMPKSPGYKQRRIDIVRAKLANGDEKSQNRLPLRATQRVGMVRAPEVSVRAPEDDALGIDGRVLRLLGQILQTTDVNAVYLWLLTAPEGEKAAAQSLIRAALTANNEQPNSRSEEPDGAAKLPETTPDILQVQSDEGGAQLEQPPPEPVSLPQTARPATRRRVSEPQYRTPRVYNYKSARDLSTPAALGQKDGTFLSKSTTPRASSRATSGLSTFREGGGGRRFSSVAMPTIREEGNARLPLAARKKSASRESPPPLENSARAASDVDRLVIDR